MPNKPSRNKQAGPRTRGTLSAATVLQRVARKSAISMPQMEAAGHPALLELLRDSVPAELRLHIIEAILRPGELVVFTESAVWAGRLRVALAELRHKELEKHPKLTLRVLPREGPRR